MKLIKPSEISARILTLLDECDERAIIVSPYMKISKWYKFMNKVNKLKAKGILIKIFVRDDPENMTTYQDLDKVALKYKKIPHLHCKLYLNERYGIVTSMNLLLSSEINSLEIGYVTETWMEYNELLEFYHRYINYGETVHYDTIAGLPSANLKDIMYNIREALNKSGKNSWLWLGGNRLHICTGWNNYSVSINDGYLRISACLKIASTTMNKGVKSSTLIVKKFRDLTSMNVDIQSGLEPVTKPDFLELSGQAIETLKSPCVNGILKGEAAYITELVIRFINATDDPESFNRS